MATTNKLSIALANVSSTIFRTSGKATFVLSSLALVLALQMPEAIGQDTGKPCKDKICPKPVPVPSVAVGTLALGAVGGIFLLKGELKKRRKKANID